MVTAAAAAAAFTRCEFMLLITAAVGRYHIYSRTLDTGQDRGWTATPILVRHFSRTNCLTHCLLACLSVGYVSVQYMQRLDDEECNEIIIITTYTTLILPFSFSSLSSPLLLLPPLLFTYRTLQRAHRRLQQLYLSTAISSRRGLNILCMQTAAALGE